MNNEHKVAVVTGAGSGIGHAVAKKLVENNVKVVGLDINIASIETLKSELKNQSVIHGLQCDVSQESEVITAFKWIRDGFGGIHIIVNCAGVMRPSLFIESTVQKWQDVLNVNILGVSICTREFMRQMLDFGIHGHIVLLNSINGHQVDFRQKPYLNLYEASKHAITALTESLRQELIYLGSKTKITSVSPTGVETEMINSLRKIYKDDSVGSKQFKKPAYLQAEDVADAILYAINTPAHVQVHEIVLRSI